MRVGKLWIAVPAALAAEAVYTAFNHEIGWTALLVALVVASGIETITNQVKAR